MVENLNNAKAWQDAVAAGKDCLSSEDLHALLENNGSEESNRHVDGCPHCQAELAMLTNFESPKSVKDANAGNEAAIEWIVARLQAQRGTVTPSPVRTAAWRSFLRLPYIAGAVAAGLIVGLGISLYVFDRPQRPVLTADVSRPQTLRSFSVHLIAPSGNLGQPPETFQWERFPGAKSYSVELLEVDGSVLWTGKSQQEFLPVGPELRARMQPGKPLLWKASALDSSGKAIAASNTEHFVVKPMNGRK